jgi:diguanylate cyclase (GGDEF)-like protein
MALAVSQPFRSTGHGNHFSCSLSAVLLARVHACGGGAAVAELLETAGSTRSVDYLKDIGNWISYDEAVALWQAGAHVTHHPQFARAVGEDAARRLASSAVATMLRSLGSPEEVLKQVATSSTKFSVATVLETALVGEGFVDIVATPVEGFPRSPDHCAWTAGLLSTTTILFGLPPAKVEHEECAAFGAPVCRYRVRWAPDESDASLESSPEMDVLQGQIDGMRQRLHSVYETAADLISAGDIADVLARITDRAATEVRAPRYLLAVRVAADGELHLHHKGFDEDEIGDYAEQLLGADLDDLPAGWLVAPVRSTRHDYGRLLAMFNAGQKFLPQERELLAVYARYAASALDSAAALIAAEQRHDQSTALLELARELAVAGTSSEIAARLAHAVPHVVDCDRVGVYVWEPTRGELVRHAFTGHEVAPKDEPSKFVPTAGGTLERLLNDPQSPPELVDQASADPVMREVLAKIGAVAAILVPLATSDTFLGLLSVSVMSAPERLALTPDLLDRLSGVAAQATTALVNGRLVDQITYQALHDELTGLANRVQFTQELCRAVYRAKGRSEETTLFYVDLDRFKPVNDEFGHAVGDELLAAVGRRLNEATRDRDLVARLGGDEFGVVIVGGAGDLDELQQRLAGAFAHPFVVGGHELRLGASIGRAVFPDDADTPDGLLGVADAAMFESKRGQRTHGAS